MSDCDEGTNTSEESEHQVVVLNISVFDGILSSPYTTRDSKLAIQSWLELTNPDGTDLPVANALHNALGSYVPQAAWHLKAVRHSLLSAASTALALEARSSEMHHHLEVSMSKQSIVHMHLAIRAILEEKEISMASALSAIMMSVVCAWTGRFEDAKRNLYFCSNLCQELHARGDHVEKDLLIAVDTMIEVIILLPQTPSGRTKQTRVKHAYQVVTCACSWIEDVIVEVKQRPQSDLLQSVLRGYRTRFRWVHRQWQDLCRTTIDTKPIRIEQTAFGPGAVHMWRWLQEEKAISEFDMRLFTTQMTLALKLTLLYGVSGDAQRTRDAALAAHAKLQILSTMLDSENRNDPCAAAHPED